MSVRRRRRNGRTNTGQVIQNTDGALAYWEMQELSGSVALAWNRADGAVLASSAYLGAELVANRKFENWTADNPDGWSVTEVGDASSNITENPADTLQMISDGTLVQTFQEIMTIGNRYRSIVEMPAASGIMTVQLGSTSFNHGAAGIFTDEGDCTASGFYLLKRATAGNWTIPEVSVREANPLNADITSATVGQPGAGGIQYMYSFDATNDYLSWSAAGITALDAILDKSKGTLIAWAKADTWAAGVDVIARIAVDGDNEIYLARSGTDLLCGYDAGGTAKAVTVASGSPTGLFMIALTWNVAGDAIIGYLNGVASGNASGLGVWAGALDATLCCIGANATTPANVWAGDIAYVQLYDETLTESEIRNIYQAGK